MSIVLSRQVAEYPCYMHHGSEKPRIVSTKEEAEKLSREGWSRSYIAHAFPKTKYSASGQVKHVETAEDEAKLGAGWYDSPADIPEPVADKQSEIDTLKARLYELGEPVSAKSGKPRKDES